jgi:hypothetical protein
MELLNFEDTAKFFPGKNARGIQNWLQSGVLPIELTVKIGRNRYFLKDKLVDFILSKQEQIQKT